MNLTSVIQKIGENSKSTNPLALLAEISKFLSYSGPRYLDGLTTHHIREFMDYFGQRSQEPLVLQLVSFMCVYMYLSTKSYYTEYETRKSGQRICWTPFPNSRHINFRHGKTDSGQFTRLLLDGEYVKANTLGISLSSIYKEVINRELQNDYANIRLPWSGTKLVDLTNTGVIKVDPPLLTFYNSDGSVHYGKTLTDSKKVFILGDSTSNPELKLPLTSALPSRSLVNPVVFPKDILVV